MKTSPLLVSAVAGALVCLSAFTAAYAQDDVDRSMLASIGEFELGNGEMHTIAHHKTAKEYRVCVKKMRHAVPLKVMYDSKEDTVAVGNCSDFEAMTIKIAPASRLDGGMVLLGKYHRLHTGQ